LVQLQQNLAEIEATGGTIVGISYDATGILKSFAEKNAITFPLLSDSGSKAIDAYGIRNKEAPARWNGIPHPGTFVLDQKGVIRSKLFIEGYRERHAVEALVKALKEAR
jgi:peroxiredoxin Q/BCP